MDILITILNVFSTTIGIIIGIILVVGYFIGTFLMLLVLGPRHKEERRIFLIILLVYYGSFFLVGRVSGELALNGLVFLIVAFTGPGLIISIARNVRKERERSEAVHKLRIDINDTILEYEDLSQYVENRGSNDKIATEHSTGIQTTVESITYNLKSIQKQLGDLP